MQPLDISGEVLNASGSLQTASPFAIVLHSKEIHTANRQIIVNHYIIPKTTSVTDHIAQTVLMHTGERPTVTETDAFHKVDK